MDKVQAINARTILVCEQGFTETVAREILAADLGYDILGQKLRKTNESKENSKI